MRARVVALLAVLACLAAAQAVDDVEPFVANVFPNGKSAPATGGVKKPTVAPLLTHNVCCSLELKGALLLLFFCLFFLTCALQECRKFMRYVTKGMKDLFKEVRDRRNEKLAATKKAPARKAFLAAKAELQKKADALQEEAKATICSRTVLESLSFQVQVGYKAMKTARSLDMNSNTSGAFAAVASALAISAALLVCAIVVLVLALFRWRTALDNKWFLATTGCIIATLAFAIVGYALLMVSFSLAFTGGVSLANRIFSRLNVLLFTVALSCPTRG
jgi:ABC-type multidrug transport system fused ATPase/permease subunit